MFAFGVLLAHLVCGHPRGVTRKDVFNGVDMSPEDVNKYLRRAFPPQVCATVSCRLG